MRISFLPSTVRLTRAAIFFITAGASGMTHGGGYPALFLRKLLAVLPGSNIRTETFHNRHLSKADLQWGRGIFELKHCRHPNTKAMHCFCSSSCRLKGRHPHCGTWMLSWRMLSCLPPIACKRQDILLKTALLAQAACPPCLLWLSSLSTDAFWSKEQATRSNVLWKMKSLFNALNESDNLNFGFLVNS